MRNGATAIDEPAVKQALAPLWAFRAILERQASWQTSDQGAQNWFHEVKAVLGKELGEFVSCSGNNRFESPSQFGS